MNLKVNIKTRIRFNGKEYSCLEDMPPQVRQAYEKALASAQASGTGLISHTTSKLIFNGHEYASVDEMPADIRRMYDHIDPVLFNKNINSLCVGKFKFFMIGEENIVFIGMFG